VWVIRTITHDSHPWSRNWAWVIETICEKLHRGVAHGNEAVFGVVAVLGKYAEGARQARAGAEVGREKSGLRWVLFSLLLRVLFCGARMPRLVLWVVSGRRVLYFCVEQEGEGNPMDGLVLQF
jgi:hypothetical protein